MTEPVTQLNDTRVLIPRMRRALELPAGQGGVEESLSDEQLNAIIADAIASVIFYTGSLFGRKLEVTARDETYLSPIAWQTDVALEEWETVAIIAQAALDYFYSFLTTEVMSETIADEASSWEWAKSPQAILERLRYLKEARNTAIEAIEEENEAVTTSWVSFIGARDELSARIIEPWVEGDPPAYNDPRFEREAAFFGETEWL